MNQDPLNSLSQEELEAEEISKLYPNQHWGKTVRKTESFPSVKLMILFSAALVSGLVIGFDVHPILNFVCWLIIICAYVYLAFIPGMYAKSIRHRNADAIAILGWFSLFFPILWPVAIVWSVTKAR